MTQQFPVAAVLGPFVIMLATLFVAVFWMVVGWRAMRAHERLARATEELARRSP